MTEARDPEKITLADIRRATSALEADITDLIQEYEETTGLTVTDLWNHADERPDKPGAWTKHVSVRTTLNR